MVKRFDRSTAAAAVLLVAAIGMGGGTAVAAGPTDAEVARLMKESFRARGLATLERLDQTESQAACSKYATTPMPPEVKARLEKAAMDRIRYPADGRYLGDFRQGERIAQSGVG